MGEREAFSTCVLTSATSESASALRGRNTSPGLVQNWPTPSVNEREEAGGDLRAARVQRLGQHEDGVHAAHLHEARDRLGPCRCPLHQRLAGRKRAGKSNGLYLGCSTSAVPISAPGPKSSAKTPGGKPHSLALRAMTCPTSLAGAGMRVVGLDDHRIAGGKCSSRVAAGHGKRQRKVAGAKDGDRAERTHHGANVGARQRLAVGLRGIDARIHPRALLDHLRKKAKLVDGARRFAFQPRFGQRRLAVRPLHKLRHDGFDAIGDVAQKSRFLPPGKLAVYVANASSGQVGGKIQVLNRSAVISEDQGARPWPDSTP